MGPGILDGFAIVFAVIGGLELVDRTSFALIALASRNRSLPTWAGGALAFAATTALAAVIGVVFETALGAGRIDLVRVGGGAFLLAYAAWIYTHPGADDARPQGSSARPAFAAAFLTILLLELGDTTMVFEIVFVPSLGWEDVALGGSLALATVAAWDVWLGRRLKSRLAPETLRRVVVIVLVLVGVLTIAYGLAPATFGALASRG